MIRSATLLSLVLSFLSGPLFAAELTERNFPRIRDFILPKPSECRWERIPWRSTLWEAVIEANQKDRPILLWAMNGHPLACT